MPNKLEVTTLAQLKIILLDQLVSFGAVEVKDFYRLLTSSKFAHPDF